MTALVSLRGVSKSFAGVRVLKDVDFDVQPGEVHALLGENGAGKSTLIKIIAGVHAPDGGTIRIGDEELAAVTPRDAVEGGIATVYQELLLFPELTVAENVFLGHAPHTSASAASTGRRCAAARASSSTRSTATTSTSTPRSAPSRSPTASASRSPRRSRQNARVLIMDEPTAALADADVRRLMVVVKRLRERGVGIIYVSHKLPEIFELADRVTVLRDGALIGTRPIAEVTEQTLVAMMVGREIDHLFPKPEPDDRRDHPQGRRPLLRRPGPRRLLRAPPRRDPRHRRPRRLRPHRAGADHLRHHPGDRRHHRARRPPGHHRLARARPATSASPTSPRTAACRAWSGR